MCSNKVFWFLIAGATMIGIAGIVLLCYFVFGGGYSREKHYELLRDGKFQEAAEMHLKGFADLDVPAEDIEEVKKVRGSTTFQYCQLHVLINTYQLVKDGFAGLDAEVPKDVKTRAALVQKSAGVCELEMSTRLGKSEAEISGFKAGANYMNQYVLDDKTEDNLTAAEKKNAEKAFKKLYSKMLENLEALEEAEEEIEGALSDLEEQMEDAESKWEDVIDAE